MELLHIASGHVFEMLGSFGIIAGLFLAAYEIHHHGQRQKVANLLAITKSHREIWSELYRQPALKRVLDPKVDLAAHPVTDEESLFVTFLLNHLNACFRASQAKMFVPVGSMERDIRWFLSLPIPKMVWEKSKALQEEQFVRFVERAME